MSYSINLGAWNSVFAVPCSVVDQNLKLAGSVQLKVLLWVLRHAGEPFEAQDIAEALGIDRADVGDAMLYWQETGVVAVNGETVAPPPAGAGQTEAAFAPEKQPVQESHPQAPSREPPPEEQKPRLLSRPQKPDNEFVARRMSESTEIACLMQSAQEILGRLISNGDSATLLMLHDNFGLPSDVIIMLLQYAASIGKSNMRYIEKAAINWADEEIFTHEKAEEKLRRLSETQKAWRTVEQTLGMPHRSPSAKEEGFAALWILQWKFSDKMVREAYDRAVDATGKFNVSYMNRILERWQKEGISTPEQAAKEKADRANPTKPGGGKEKPLTFDIDEYERTSVNDTRE